MQINYQIDMNCPMRVIIGNQYNEHFTREIMYTVFSRTKYGSLNI